MIIAIDGFAAAGKGTLAKDLAKHLNFLYIDTGAMYRAITLALIRSDKLHLPEKEICSFVINQDIQFSKHLDKYRTLLNDEDVEDEIRNFEVSENVSLVSSWECVRNHLKIQQRKIGENNSVVMDGRDIGTVIFPNADYKFFVKASPEVRAERRFKQIKDIANRPSIEEILNNIKTRDYKDSNRKIAPLQQASDAILIDNTNLTRKEQFEKVLKHIS